MAKRSTIAVVIPVKNVAEFVKPTMESLTWCDEVIIVDMFSTDDTKKICTSYENCKFYERDSYIYDNVNYGIEQATTDWVMRLDSDEIVPDALREELINDVLTENKQGLDGYSAQSNLYFFGQHLKYGWGKDNWRCTIFKKGFAKYEAKSEHEEMICEGTWGKLKNRYDHFTNPTISRWINKINYYSDRDLERFDIHSDNMTILRIIYRCLRWFQRFYIYPGMSFLDGRWGFVTSVLGAWGILLQDFKQWEKQERIKPKKPGSPEHPNLEYK